MTREERTQIIRSKYKSLVKFARAIKEPKQRVNDIISGARKTARICQKFKKRLGVGDEYFQ